MTNTEFNVGTRGSSLALRQTELVVAQLQSYFPELTWTKHGIDESFPGDIINKNWDGVPDGKIL